MDTFEHWEITFTLAAGCGEEDAMALRDWIEEDDRVSGAALSGHNDHPRGAVSPERCECGEPFVSNGDGWLTCARGHYERTPESRAEMAEASRPRGAVDPSSASERIAAIRKRAEGYDDPHAGNLAYIALLENEIERLDAQLRGAVCACGFAGTDVTPEGKCGTCGKPLDQQSVAWLAREYGRLRRQLEGAVGDE